MSELDANATVSVEQDGRTLSGVGVTKESLQETMDARAPVDDTSAASLPAGSAPDPAAVPADASQPKPTRGQARYSELTHQRDSEKALREAAEKERDELKARFAQQPPTREDRPLGTAGRPATEGDASRQAAPPTRPKPSEDDVKVGGKYESYGAYVDDLTDWKAEQQQAALPQYFQQHQAQQAFLAHVETTRTKGRAAYKDFDTMLQSGPGTHVNMPAAAVQAIFHLPNSEHVQYAIMKDGALAHRLAVLADTNPYAFGLELARIAPAAPAASPASTGTPGHATPPAPLQPVGAGSTTTRLSSAEAAKAGNYAEYKALRAAERGGSRRR